MTTHYTYRDYTTLDPADRARALITTADVVAGIIAGTDDLGRHFSCSEAEPIAEFLAAYGWPDCADGFMIDHASSDEPGDDHYLEPTPVPPTFGEMIVRRLNLLFAGFEQSDVAAAYLATGGDGMTIEVFRRFGGMIVQVVGNGSGPLGWEDGSLRFGGVWDDLPADVSSRQYSREQLGTAVERIYELAQTYGELTETIV